MSNTLNNTMDAAKDLMESAKSGTEHAASSARSTLLDGIHAVSSVVSMLRALQVNDALGWVGLERRRGPAFPLLAFGAGIIVGAGVGMMIAPRSGEQTRRALLDALMGAEKKVEAEAKEIEKKAEKMAGKVEDKVVENASAAKEAIKTKAEEAAGVVKETVDEAKAAFASTDPFRDNKGEKASESKTGKPMSGAGIHRVS